MNGIVRLQERFIGWKLFVVKNRREVLIATTTVLLCSQAMLLSQLTQKKEHQLSRELSITLLFELSKLLISSTMFFFNYDSDSNQVMQNFSLGDSVLYALPAIIYLINDNLIFTIISMLEDPTTFEILANIRILTTSIIFRLVFNRSFHRVQWAALLLLCIGSATSQLVTCGDFIVSNITPSVVLLVLVYCILSACAGIYTEYLMKRRPNDSFYLQNMQLYAWGSIINTFVLFAFYSDSVSETGFLGAIRTDFLTFLTVVNHALCGLAISAIIRYTDNIARVYTHSMGMVLTMVVSSLWFWEVPSIQLLFGMCTVIISLYLFYTMSPDNHNKTLPTQQQEKEDI